MKRKKRDGRILWQTALLLYILMNLAIILSGMALYIGTGRSYAKIFYQEKKEALNEAQKTFNAAPLLPWFFDYLEEHPISPKEYMNYNEAYDRFLAVLKDAGYSADELLEANKIPLTVEDVEKLSPEAQQVVAEYECAYFNSVFEYLKAQNGLSEIWCTDYANGEKPVDFVGSSDFLEKDQPLFDQIYATGKAPDTMQLSTGKRDQEEYGAVYGPVITEGSVRCIIGAAAPLSEIVKKTEESIRNVFLVLFAALLLVGLVVLIFLYFRLIRPITRVQTEIRDYTKVQNSAKAIEKLTATRQRNEVGKLSDDLVLMMQEIDRYVEEVVSMTAEQERIGAELNVATQIQADMLPQVFPPFPDRNEFDLFASMTPAKEVGGDFYDFFLIDDDHLALVIGDVSGKGVPAALFMVISKTLIKNRAMSGGSPAEILTEVNKSLCEGNSSKMFVTVWLAILTISTGHVVEANAGHESPAIRHGEDGFSIYKTRHGFVMGGRKSLTYKEDAFDLEPGDVLFVYTDGVPEATDGKAELFGKERMLEALNRAQDCTPDELLPAVRREIDAFVGDAPQFDDLTMMALRYKGTE